VILDHRAGGRLRVPSGHGAGCSGAIAFIVASAGSTVEMCCPSNIRGNALTLLNDAERNFIR
jgi:pantoate kinase